MNIYKKKILRDEDEKTLRTIDSEVLRVEDRTQFSTEGVEWIVRHPLAESVFRFYILNEDETIDYEIPQEDIILDKSTYTETYQQGVRRNVTLSLINSSGKYTPSTNGIWINTKFRFDVGISFGGAEKWYRKGVYVLEDPFQTNTASDNMVDFQLTDKFQRLIGKTGALESTYEIPVGSDIKDAVQGILDIRYGGGKPIDSISFVYDESFIGRTTPFTLTKDSNSTLGDIILDLAYMLNAECYYNEFGQLCIRSMREGINDYNKPILWHFKENDDGSLEHSGETIRYKFTEAINEIHIIGDNINGNIFNATIQNTDVLSPISVQMIGRRALLINDSNISSDEQASDRAIYELRNASILGVEVSLQTYFVPFLEVNSIIEADDSFLHWYQEQLLIKSLSFNIGSNSVMSLTCASVDNLPFENS